MLALVHFLNPASVKGKSPIFLLAVQYNIYNPHQLSQLLTLSMASVKTLAFLDVFKVHFFSVMTQWTHWAIL
jgi:hypothetical protein